MNQYSDKSQQVTATQDAIALPQIPLRSENLSVDMLKALNGSMLLQTLQRTESLETYFATHPSHPSHSSHATAAWSLKRC